MKEDLLSKYTGRRLDERSAPRGVASSSDEGIEDDLGCFGWLRGSYRDRAMCLELRKRAGNRLAISYGWIERVGFDPSGRITLHMPRQEISITGRHLNASNPQRPGIFDGLIRAKVTWVQEADLVSAISVANDLALVETIEW